MLVRAHTYASDKEGRQPAPVLLAFSSSLECTAPPFRGSVVRFP